MFSQYDESPDWRANGAGFHHSHKHGFGLLNAWRMVNAAKVPVILCVFILCSHVTTMATWKANADKMVMNSGQPRDLKPCRFPILHSINYSDHMSQNVKIYIFLNKEK